MWRGGTMESPSDLFDRLDAWRHLPNYQLERRADVFFSLYLPEALGRVLGFPVSDVLVPEFPVRIGTIYPDIPIDKSYKIDYLTVSVDGRTPIFVELKTEGASRRESQDKYLSKSQQVGLTALLDGLCVICKVTNAKRKYEHLLLELERLGVMQRSAEGTWHPTAGDFVTPLLVYVQPNPPKEPDTNTVIAFHEFADVVAGHEDAFSQRFAVSLREWADITAGHSHRTSGA